MCLIHTGIECMDSWTLDRLFKLTFYWFQTSNE